MFGGFLFSFTSFKLILIGASTKKLLKLGNVRFHRSNAVLRVPALKTANFHGNNCGAYSFRRYQEYALPNYSRSSYEASNYLFSFCENMRVTALTAVYGFAYRKPDSRMNGSVHNPSEEEWQRTLHTKKSPSNS